ncbi:MAG: hypothetical protein JSV31_11885 [Desulfobacterales bacterium]|nr:MAG: hypothetical protein JSV31_11885 [Desulfobacterales bacterium]
MKLMHPVEEQKNEPIAVHNFIFPDGHLGALVGYNRGIGPLHVFLEAWEVPIGVYTDTGEYYGFIFDKRGSEMENEPTFRIGDTDYYNRILYCYLICEKVDPKTGSLIVDKVVQQSAGAFKEAAPASYF